MKDNWQLAHIDIHVVNQLQRELGVDELVARLLCARGVTGRDEAEDYLDPRLSYLYSPFLLRDMDAAVDRMRLAVERKEQVGIFSDSDLDGLTSLALLVSLLEKLQLKYTCRYPVENEKYGITVDMVDEFANSGVELLFMLDSGVRDVDEIRHARSLGMDVIVCDHHQPDQELPDSIVVNPCRDDCNYPFNDLAGVGVTFKFCHAVLLSYTGNFTIPFVLLAENGEGLAASVMLRGMIIRRWDNLSFDDLIEYLENSFSTVQFFHLDMSTRVLDELKSRYDGENIFNLSELMSSVHRKKQRVYKNAVTTTYPVENESQIDYIESLVREMQLAHSEKITGHIRESLPLVALGTIADLMPLKGENRILVSHGLKNFENLPHNGIAMLLRELNKTVSSRVVGWDIAPLLNTPGRFGKTYLTADFLISRDIMKVRENLFTIKELNEYRKDVIMGLYNGFMKEIIEGNIDVSGAIVYIESDSCPEGLTGLLANRIADDLQKPVIVVSMLPGVTVVKGSGRANNTIDFFSIIEPFSESFVKIGGHAQAFGFSAEKESLRNVIRTIQMNTPRLQPDGKEWNVDCELDVHEVRMDMLDKIAIFEPFGVQNEPFVFLSRNCVVQDVQLIGKNKKHLKCHFRDATSVDALWWNMADKVDIEKIMNTPVDIIFNLEINEFNGRINPQIIIRDLHFPANDGT